MPFHNPSNIFRERILVFGAAGSGKSYGYYTLARLALTTKSDAHFYIIDTDESVGRMLVDPAFESLTDDDYNPYNITFESVSSWEELTTALTHYQGIMRPQDWLMIDMLTPSWDWCQSYFTNQVFGKNLDQFFLEARRSMSQKDKGGSPFEGWRDWPTINQIYAAFQTQLLRCKGNLYCTAEIKSVNRDTMDKEAFALFGPHGVQPSGQKRIPFLFSTILLTAEPRPNVRTLTTVKDRSREPLAGFEVGDFAKDYLVKTGKWKLI